MIPRFLRIRFAFLLRVILLSIVAAGAGTQICSSQAKPAAAPDELVLSNGDTLHGKFVSSLNGKVTFHSDPLGDVTLTWDKIKALHAAEEFAVLDKNVKLRRKKTAGQIPVGTIEVADQALTVHPQGGAAPATVPVKDAQYVIDQPTLDKQAFQLAIHDTAVTDFYDENQIRAIYYPEMERLVKEQTGAETLEQAFLSLTGSTIRDEDATSTDQMRNMARMFRGNRR